MSLLLEALKKAERAKEEAQRRARAEGADAAAAPAPDAKPVVTRDKLPDISPSLEIVTEDLAPAPAPARERPPLEIAPDPSPASPPPKEGPRPRAAANAGAEEQAAKRASAKKVFEAKFREPNPRMPFYITMGALGVFAMGTIIYFWYQLRPPPSLVNLNPQRQAQESVAATQPAPGAAPTSAPSASASATPAGIPGLPTAPAKSGPPAPASLSPNAPAPAASAAPRAPAETAPEVPRLRPAPRALEPRQVAPAPSEPTTSATRPPPQVNPKVAAGYAAYISRDFSTARGQYEEALRDEPANRDALLGLAALDVRAGRYESAEALYLRVLQADPRDPQAQAALIGLRAGRSDPLANESRVKSLLAAEPGAHALNFTLGNQLAAQNRWPEAQQEYFKAYTGDPDNADFAYNLAVSLDHLRQPRQALDYYQRAITLGDKHGASFDLGAARARAAQLAR